MDRDSYDVEFEIDSLAMTHEGGLAARSSTASSRSGETSSYSLSPYKSDADANEDGDEELERLLLETATNHKGGAVKYKKRRYQRNTKDKTKTQGATTLVN